MELQRLISRAWRSEAYGTFRHPAVAPLTELNPNLFVLELFHGPTLAFKDLAMQLVARLMDHVLHNAANAPPLWWQHRAIPAARRSKRSASRAQVDVVVLFPQDRISDVQRRMMTTVPDVNVHALAIEGTFDDCQALVKAMFNHHAFRDRVRLSGVNSINWARIVAQTVYYFTAAVALGAPHRKVAFTVPTGNFGDVYAGYVASRMGLPVDRLVVATNVNDILGADASRPAHTKCATSWRPRRRRWTSRSRRISSGCCSTPMAAMRGAVRASDGLARAIAPLRAVGARRSSNCARMFTADRADEQESAADHPHLDARDRLLRRSAYGGRHWRWPKRKRAIRRCRWWCSSTAHPAKFPDAVEAACGIAPALPEWLADLRQRPERVTVLPADQAAVERFRAVGVACAHVKERRHER